MKFKDYVEIVTEQFEYDTVGGGKYRTDLPLNKRSFKNIPKYANGKNMIKFQDWLHIKPQKRDPSHSVATFGKSEADGKWYGWSHRAVYGFKAGDKITGDSSAKKVVYPKLPDGDFDWDNGKYEDDFKIKDDKHAMEVAMRFAENVA